MVIELSDPRTKLADLMGMQLGQGLGEGINSYYMNKAIDDVINDKSLANAPQSQKVGRLHQALLPYGEKGMNWLNQRLQIDQMEEQEKQQALEKKGASELWKTLHPDKPMPVGVTKKDILDLEKIQRKAPPGGISGQPIPPEQMDKIEKVIQENPNATTNELNIKLGKAGVNPSYSKDYIENLREENKISSKEFDRSYSEQKGFIDDVTSRYQVFETEMKPRLLQMQSMDPEKIASPTAAVFLESLGIPLGALDDPSSELYQKLSQDLLKGLPETYGNRILKVEVDNFLKTIPTLLNSPEGRRMIASNMLKLGEMKEVFYNEMRKQQKSALENKKMPKDFQQSVFDQVKPQIDRLNNEFVKMAEVTSVPEGTIPFFDPQGNISFVPKEHVQWAQENQGRRIW